MTIESRCAWLLTGVLALLPRTAVAQDDVSSESRPEGESAVVPADSQGVDAAKESAWTYPKSYSVRPLTLQRGMIRETRGHSHSGHRQLQLLRTRVHHRRNRNQSQHHRLWHLGPLRRRRV